MFKRSPLVVDYQSSTANARTFRKAFGGIRPFPEPDRIPPSNTPTTELWCYEGRVISRGTPRYLGPGSLYKKHNAIYSYLRMYKGRYLSVWVAELAIFCAHKRVWPLFRSSVINGLQKRSELHLAKRLPRANMNGITCFDHVLHVLIKIYLRRSFFVR